MSLSWPTLTEGQWNKIATAVTSGTIKQLKSEFTYWCTSVLTGATAPADSIKDKSPILFIKSNVEIIQDFEPIDIYIWIENADLDNDSSPENCIEVNAE